jgi:glycine betaine/choline ABC-type transport system substrate-binding protein
VEEPSSSLLRIADDILCWVTRLKFLPALACGLALLPACSGRRPIVVASKNFTEQLVLGEIVAQHLENRLHQTVDRRFNLGGSLLAHQALLAKDIDLYPEYTGTAYTAILKHKPIADAQLVLDRVRAEYASNFALKWCDPLGFDDSFAMVIRGADARTGHFVTLSDAERRRDPWTLGVGYEFLTRPDGYQTLMASYPQLHWTGFPKTMDLGLLYRALDQGQVTMAAANTTDGLLSVLDVKVLQDDRNAFPPYQASIVVRYDSLSAHPGLEAVLAELSGKITADEMRRLNYEVDGKHRPVHDVASDFLGTIGHE